MTVPLPRMRKQASTIPTFKLHFLFFENLSCRFTKQIVAGKRVHSQVIVCTIKPEPLNYPVSLPAFLADMSSYRCSVIFDGRESSPSSVLVIKGFYSMLDLQDAGYEGNLSTDSMSLISNELTALRMDLIDSSRPDDMENYTVSRVSTVAEESFSMERLLENIEKTFFVRFTSTPAAVAEQDLSSPRPGLMVTSASFNSKSNAGSAIYFLYGVIFVSLALT